MSAWLVLGIVACAVGAISARRLLSNALWLAATSVLLAIFLATIDAPIVAVIEVSVGAGLVAVLFVFTIGIAGEEGLHSHSVVPKPLALVLVTLAAVLLLWLTVPFVPVLVRPGPALAAVASLGDVIWRDRAADLLGQMVLIVVAALTVRTILGSDRRTPAATPARRDERQAGNGHAPLPRAAVAPAVQAPDPAPAASPEETGAREEVTV